jgi:hypothetical protein
MDPHDFLRTRLTKKSWSRTRSCWVNDRDKEIEYRDPRFNDLDELGFGVARNDDGTYTAYLACNRLEYAFFRFVLANVAGPEHDTDDEAMENFRKEA